MSDVGAELSPRNRNLVKGFQYLKKKRKKSNIPGRQPHCSQFLDDEVSCIYSTMRKEQKKNQVAQGVDSTQTFILLDSSP